MSIGGVCHYASLYRQEDSSTLHSHRLFPIYSYRHDLVQDVAQTSVLLAYEHEQHAVAKHRYFDPVLAL